MNDEDELAATVHGSLVATHSISTVYWLTRDDRELEDYVYAGIHFTGAVFSAVSVWRHLNEQR